MDKLGEGGARCQPRITVEQLIATARRILHPYTLEVKEVPWWSVYEIGQRICDKYDDVPAKETGAAAAARVHRRRCLPHAQPQGRARA
jgi:phenol 2-monooxygenase/3-hydroxybenzoate 4-monooxygenase